MLCVFGFNVWKKRGVDVFGKSVTVLFFDLENVDFSQSCCDKPLVTLSRLRRNAVSESESARNPAQLGFGSIHTHG